MVYSITDTNKSVIYQSTPMEVDGVSNPALILYGQMGTSKLSTHITNIYSIIAKQWEKKELPAEQYAALVQHVQSYQYGSQELINTVRKVKNNSPVEAPQMTRKVRALYDAAIKHSASVEALMYKAYEVEYGYIRWRMSQRTVTDSELDKLHDRRMLLEKTQKQFLVIAKQLSQVFYAERSRLFLEAGC